MKIGKLLAVVVTLVLVWAWGCARQERILIEEPVNYQNSLSDARTSPGYPLRQDVFIYKIKNGLPYRVEIELGESKIDLNAGGLHIQPFKKILQSRVITITSNVFDVDNIIIGTIVRYIKIPSYRGWGRSIEEDIWHIVNFNKLTK